MQKPASLESQVELDSQDAPLAAQRHAPAQTRSSGGGDSVLWILLGLGSLTVGVILAAAPNISWTASKIAERLAAMGVHSGVAVVGGLTLMVLGLIRRGQNAARAELQYDSSLLFEQIASELVEIRGSLESATARGERFEARVDELSKDLLLAREALSGELQALTAREGNNSALFQLASGLDKLGLRVEQRLRLHHSTLQESVDELAATLEHSRRSLEEQIHALSATQQDTGEYDATAAYDASPYEAAQPEATEYESAPSEVIARDATPLELAAQQAPYEAPQASARPRQDNANSLGLLDQFDDVAPALPTTNAAPASQRAPEQDFGANQGDTHAELDRAARSLRTDATWDEQMMVEHQDLDTKTKLLQLESLLSDERLRSALDAMRRQP